MHFDEHEVYWPYVPLEFLLFNWRHLVLFINEAIFIVVLFLIVIVCCPLALPYCFIFEINVGHQFLQELIHVIQLICVVAICMFRYVKLLYNALCYEVDDMHKALYPPSLASKVFKNLLQYIDHGVVWGGIVAGYTQNLCKGMFSPVAFNHSFCSLCHLSRNHPEP